MLRGDREKLPVEFLHSRMFGERMMAELQFDTSQVMVDFNQMKSFADDPLILERGKGIRVYLIGHGFQQSP